MSLQFRENQKKKLQVNGTLAFDHCLLTQTDVSLQIDIWDIQYQANS